MSDEKKFPALPSASVAVTIPIGHREELTYRIPEELQNRLVPGMWVIVSVGSRKTTGIVTSLSELGEGVDLGKVKDILEILDEGPVFPQDLVHLWRRISRYYLASPAEMLSTMLPRRLKYTSTQFIKLRKGPSAVRRPPSAVQSSTISGGSGGSDDAPDASIVDLEPQLTEVQQTLLSLLKEKKRIPLRTLRSHFSPATLTHALRTLEMLALIERKEYLPGRRTSAPVVTDELEEAAEHPHAPSPFVLSGAQQGAAAQVAATLHRHTFQVFLLHGITGSGKTEVYLQVAREAVAQGRSVLILVPEIGLTHQLIERVRQSFGKHVAVLHSALAERARWQEWQRIAHGRATVVVGVRSAVFAPLVRLGLIVVDEEHDPSYKQEEGVHYNARDVAVIRGQIASCPVILGSATPSLESYAHGRARRYTLLELPERFESRPLPRVEIVDLRRQARSNNAERIFSPTLRQALIDTYQVGQQSLLFLNRRGYASSLQCHACGEVLSCVRCSVALTLHLQEGLLRCHYCGFARPVPDACPRCRHPTLEKHGIGTEQVEEALRTFLPNVRFARLDRDSASPRGALERVLRAWHAHEIDVLVGTQMVTKGHDVPGVTLVGVLLADLSLNLPDFRSAERTFQLLVQVAGRAGRGHEPGRVIIQTYVPQHYSVRCAAQHDFKRFAVQELRYRSRLKYPPFSRLVNLRIEGKEGEEVQTYAERLAHSLLAQLQGQTENLMILGPAPAALERIKGRTRWQILLKGEDRRALHALVRKAQETIEVQRRRQEVRVIVDVDPYNML